MISNDLENHFSNIADILNEIGDRVEGNLVCDVSADNLIINRNLEKIQNLKYLSNGKQNICEIGVNAGHSLLIMLDENPNANYQLFDLGNHRYTKPCLDYIKSEYPNTNINITYGDSKETIRDYIFNNKSKIQSYDLIHIDGGHGDLELTSDFYMSSILIKKDGVLIMDDYDYPNIENFIDDRLKVGSIRRYKDENLKITNRHFIYTY